MVVLFSYSEGVDAMESHNVKQVDIEHPYWRFSKQQETLNKQHSQKFSKREF